MRALIECAAECKVTLEERSDTTGVKGLYKQNYQRFNNIDAAKCFFVCLFLESIQYVPAFTIWLYPKEHANEPVLSIMVHS